MGHLEDEGGSVVKVLVIGRGGREHALCWKLKQSPRVTSVICAPGNAGTAIDCQNVSIEPGDTRGLVQFAKREGVGLSVVGSEEPLAKGIVDAFQREGLRIFGPRKEAAELEGSKLFAKELMRQAGIPTADYRVFRSGPDAEHYVMSREVALIVRSQGARQSATRCTAGRPKRHWMPSIGSWILARCSARECALKLKNADRNAFSAPRQRLATSYWDGRWAWS